MLRTYWSPNTPHHIPAHATQHNTSPHCTALNYKSLHRAALHTHTLPYATLPYTALHHTTQHCTAPHRAAPHRTAPHRTDPHRSAPHRNTLHNTTALLTALVAFAQKCTQHRTLIQQILDKTWDEDTLFERATLSQNSSAKAMICGSDEKDWTTSVCKDRQKMTTLSWKHSGPWLILGFYTT